VDKTGLFEHAEKGPDASGALKGKRRIYLEGDWVEVPVYNRDKLSPGNRMAGPAVIEERITTVIVHPGWDARVDTFENILMEARS
jgi:N-methylhydantoinase A